MLCWVFTQEKQEIFEDGEEAEAEPSQFSCPAYVELLEFMDRASMSVIFPTIALQLR